MRSLVIVWSLLLLFLPTYAAAQLDDAISCRECNSKNGHDNELYIKFIGTVAEEKFKLGLPIATRFAVDHVYIGPDMDTIIVHHPADNFSFFPGEHVIHAHKDSHNNFTASDTKHGEIISTKQRQMRGDNKKRNSIICSIDVSKELCLLATKEAYENETLTGEFILEDSKCLQYKDEYDDRYR